MATQVEELVARLEGLEQEVASIREELNRLTLEGTAIIPAKFLTDKATIRRAIDAFVDLENIQGKPIDAETLQAQIASEGLTDDELSRDLINAREARL